MKNRITLCLLAILSLCGCQTLELNNEMSEDKVFSATIEDSFYETKTSLDEDGNVLWKKGDQVSIFAGNTINQQYQVTDASDGKKDAEFNKVSEPGFVSSSDISTNVAYYPYSSSVSIVEKSGKYEISGVSLPSTQDYVSGSFGNGVFPMVAVTSSTADYNLRFKNVLGGLKLQLKGTAKISSIKVQGNKDEVLCGSATVTASNGSTPSIKLTDASAKTVTLDCGTGVQLNISTATSFVIALPPVTMAGGFTVVVTDTEGKEMEIKTEKSQTITRSSLLKMPVVNYEGTSQEPEGTPLTFTSTGATTISLEKTGSPNAISIEYRRNDGDWTSYSIGNRIPLKDKDQVSFRSSTGGNSKFSKSTSDYYYFYISGKGTVAASGNIMSLASQDMESLTIPYQYFFCNLFRGCYLLTTAPELPATSLAPYCYELMFYECTSLTQAPKLPGIFLSYSCYQKMFYGCSSLTSAPELPATTLKDYCYCSMFRGCSSLPQAPELPATSLAYGCYWSMFTGCTSLTIAPKELPATSLAVNCYNQMFYSCTSLTAAPELPATSLALNCYEGMFSGCTSLTTAPELPATTLANRCYGSMFSGCTNLNYVKALFTTTPSDSYTDHWLEGVSSTGTFVKSKDATWDVSGPDGIPEGWTVITE